MSRQISTLDWVIACGTLNCTDQCLHRLIPSLKNEVNFNNLIDLGEVQMTNT
jgi:hypothetical protein